MWNFLTTHAQSALAVALISSAISLLGSGMSVYFTYTTSLSAQDRQAGRESVQKFDATNSQLLEAGGDFIDALNNSKDLQAAKAKIRTAAAQQIYEIGNIKILLGKDRQPLINEYQSAIADFNNITQGLKSVGDIGSWAERYGRVLDLKSDISKEARSKLNIS